jgi:hypothetical protein
MYSNMKIRVKDWVRPLDYPITERSAKDVWFAYRGLDPRAERAKISEYARSVWDKKRGKHTRETDYGNKPFLANIPLGESGDLLHRLSDIINSHDSMAKELKETRAFILGLLPLVSNLETAFKMGIEELSLLQTQATAFLSGEVEMTSATEAEILEKESPTGPVCATSPSPDLQTCFQTACKDAESYQKDSDEKGVETASVPLP